MIRVKKREIEDIFKKIGNKSVKKTIRVTDEEWKKCSKAMKELKMPFSALCRHITVDVGAIPGKVLKMFPMPRHKEVEFIEKFHPKSSSHTYNMPNMILYFLMIYLDEIGRDFGYVVRKWLKDNGYD